jgi:Flp pilus assembly protein TadD
VKRLRAALGAALALLVAIAFAGVLRNGFLTFDDDLYVTANPLVLGGLTLRGVAEAFTTFHAGNWHPLTWLSHMTDVELFGLDPAAHHAVNAALHALNAVLLFLALTALTRTTWRAALVAAFFGVHPLHVESVAWVAERKDLLSTAFGLLSLLAWARWARGGSRAAWGTSLACFALALLAKPMLVTLPFLMLVLDAWPLERLRGREDVWPRVREKLAFFALAFGACAVTLVAQQPAITPAPFALRVANALLAFPAYLSRAFWPAALAVQYPYRTVVPYSDLGAAAALVAAITGLAVWQARRRPWLLVGWLWFAGMLVPTLGLIQVGVQSSADRYTYLPLVGVAIAIVWSAAELVERAPRLRPLAAAAAVLLLALCVLRTRAQVEAWRDNTTLFTHATEVTPDNWFAHGELGIALAASGETARGRAELETALRIHPGYPRALANLGTLRAETGEPDAGVADLQHALELDPTMRGARVALGVALERARRLAEARAQYETLLARDPDDRTVELQLARLLAIAPDPALRDGDRAVVLSERACGAEGCTAPRELDVLAMAYMEAGRREDAMRTALQAIELARAAGDPSLAEKIRARYDGYARGEPVRLPPRPSPGG